MSPVIDVERIQPLDDRVFIRLDPPEERTRGGIWIPDVAKRRTGRGTVLAMGPGMPTRSGGRWPMPDIKPGDRVIFSATESFPITEINGEKVIVIRDDCILAVEEP